MSEVRANALTDIHPIIAGRWSPRAFDATRFVEKSKLIACLEAARWAPSCFGDEPWRLIVCDRSQDEGAWLKLLDCLTPKNQAWAKHAPVLMLSCAATRFRKGNPNRWGEYDTGQAAVSLCLQAESMGLATHQMGGFDSEAARAAFAIPAEFTPMAAMALGYQADAGLLEEGLRVTELGERTRKPMGDCFFAGNWNRPVA